MSRHETSRAGRKRGANNQVTAYVLGDDTIITVKRGSTRESFLLQPPPDSLE